MAWAENLSYYDPVRSVTYTDWRLPTALNQDGSGPDSGYNVASSEMGHMYYAELGNVAGGGGFTNTGFFINLQPDTYWSSTEVASAASDAWAFRWDPSSGEQFAFDKEDGDFHAWAVRSGDVVPEPATLGLLLLGGLAMLRRRH